MDHCIWRICPVETHKIDDKKIDILKSRLVLWLNGWMDHVYLEELYSNYSKHKLEQKGHQHDVTNSFNGHNDALDNALKTANTKLEI